MGRAARLNGRDLILEAADALIYDRGFSAVSIDDLVAKAGVSRKTFYYYFRSKDDLVVAYLDYRGDRALDRFFEWAGHARHLGPLAELLAILDGLAELVQRPAWRGCGFARISAELAHFPGHPAHAVSSRAKARLENHFRLALEADGVPDAEAVARRVLMLIDGVMMMYTIRRDMAYFHDAREALRLLIGQARADTSPMRAATL